LIGSRSAAPPRKELVMPLCPSRRAVSAVALVLGFATGTSHAALAVIDSANLAQSVQQVAHNVTQISNQVRQIIHLQTQISSMNGARLLGTVANNPLLQNYIPANAFAYLNTISVSGYAGLNASAKALRDAAMVYNCLDLTAAARTACQAALAQPYQHKGLLQDAMSAASGRLAQITALMAQIDATTDQKSVLEIQARIGVENALLAHEMSQVQMLQGMADSEERIARSRDRERQYEMLNRPGKIADFLP
jgi:type IV secretion system protein VirB5